MKTKNQWVKRVISLLLILMTVATMLSSCVAGEAGTDGKDGIDGKTPTFKVEDGELYVSYDEGESWTVVGSVGGEDGKDGKDGKDGTDGKTPKLKINPNTNEWEVSYDNGKTWTSLGVKATESEGEELKFSIEADVFMIPCYGQSLSINTSAGASTFNYVEPLSYDINLNNSNVQDMCAGTVESFRMMAEYYNLDLPENFKIISCTGGAGGKSIGELSKGSTYYNNVINNIKTAKASCDAAGLTMVVPCFTWTQGEEDMRAGGDTSKYGTGSFNPFTYKNRLKKLIDDLNTDIKAITGQTTDVLCISYQVASHTTYARYPRIALQQQELALEDNRMILAKVMYDVDYVTENNGSSKMQIHAPAATYRNMGNMYGISIFRACVMKQEVSWLHPIDYSIEGNKVYVKFEVPCKPLQLDTVLVNNLPDGNFGFQIYKVDEQSGNNGSIKLGDTKITKVELYSEDTVMLTLSQTPLSGETLTYGINGDYWQNINGTLSVLTGGEGEDNITKSGRQYGSRGCLHDSQSFKNQNSGAVYKNLYNWCAIFEIPFYEGIPGVGEELLLPENLDADAREFLVAAKISDTATVGKINTLVLSLKNQGLWEKIDALYPCVGNTFQQMSYNLKDPTTYRLMASGTVTVDKNVGFYSTGRVTSDTPTVAGSDIHLLGYSLTKYTDVDNGMLSPGPSCNNGLSVGVLALAYKDGVVLRTSQNTNLWSSETPIDGDGLFIGSLTSGIVYNGSSIGAAKTGTPSVESWSDLFVHNGYSQSDPTKIFGTYKVGLSGFGKGLTTTEMQAYSEILNQFKSIY